MQLSRRPERRRRLSDAETERRMLDAGARLVGVQGLSLSLEHVRMEDLIADAGVSRTSSYRRWPTKDAFAADLLLHIAENTRLTTDSTPYADALGAVPAALLDGLETPQGRRDLVVEAFRLLTTADFTAALESPAWRSFVMLRAAHPSLPAGELRDRVTAALAHTERGFAAYRAQALAGAAALIGYRLTAPDAVDWPTLAELSGASFTGMLVRAFSDPDSVLADRACAPFGSSAPAAWNLATLAAGGVFFGATEPDPTTPWDAERIAATRALLADTPAVLATLWPDRPE